PNPSVGSAPGDPRQDLGARASRQEQRRRIDAHERGSAGMVFGSRGMGPPSGSSVHERGDPAAGAEPREGRGGGPVRAQRPHAEGGTPRREEALDRRESMDLGQRIHGAYLPRKPPERE